MLIKGVWYIQKGEMRTARPVKYRKVCRMPLCRKFYGGEMCESVIALTVEEYETLRLIDYQGLSQEACARQMEASRATIQALYAEARKKTARFLVEGTSLIIEGGHYEICQSKGRCDLLKTRGRTVCEKEGASNMKIAVTYENGQVFQHFGHTEQFKIYEVADGKITSAEVVDTNGQGHGALGGFLAEAGVNVLICGGIGGGARNALAAAGIQLFGGACGDADEQVKSFLAGNLAYDPNVECQHHGEGHDCGGHGHEGGCGNHGCH